MGGRSGIRCGEAGRRKPRKGKNFHQVLENIFISGEKKLRLVRSLK
jgi:hypothetical protein